MKTKILVAALAAGMVAAPSAQAAVQISGQVNVAALFGSAADDLTVVDNNTTGSRFRFKASKKFGNGFSVGTRYELQAQFAQSNDPDQIGLNSGNADPIGATAADGTPNDNAGPTPVREVRHAEVWLKGAFGKFTIGRGDGAANGTSESYGLLNFLGGAEAHLLFGGVGADFSDVDGDSRQNRIRYDSPSFSGFRFAATLDDQDEQEIAAFYNGKGSWGKLRARVGLAFSDASDSFDASVAFKFPFGLGLAASTGNREDANGVTTTENVWLMASYDISKHFLVSIGTGTEDDLIEIGEVEDDLTIISAVWKPVKGSEIYLNYGDWENGDDGASDDVFALGARFKF